jgi:acetyltransferase
MATRFCFVDYDRTMAIVAEVEHAGDRQLIGVGRLVADADHSNAEYAVLIADDWQGRGVGRLLTAYCLEICRTWGINYVFAETTTDNERMRRIFQKYGFHLKRSNNDEILYELRLSEPPVEELPKALHESAASPSVI